MHKMFFPIVIFAVIAGYLWGLAPDSMMYELLDKPCTVAITSQAPSFSWGFKDALPRDYQQAYQIQVASKTSLLRSDTPDLWDSGKIVSHQSLHIRYQGRTLPAAAHIFWRVRVWDRRDNPGEWSQVISITTAPKLGTYTPLRYPAIQRTVKPLKLVTNQHDRVFIDFGRAAFGWAEMIVPLEMERGGEYILRLGEKANQNSVVTEPGGSIRYTRVLGALTQPGIYRVPLEAEQRHLEGVAGIPPIKTPEEFGVIMPFRYIEVEKSPIPIGTDTIRQIAVGYPFDTKAAAFVSSDPILDKVYNFCKYSVRATTFANMYVSGERDRMPHKIGAQINQVSHYACDRDYTLARYTFEHLVQQPPTPLKWRQPLINMAWNDWMYTGNTELLIRWYEQLQQELPAKSLIRKSDGMVELKIEEADLEYNLRGLVAHQYIDRDGFEFKPVNAIANAYYCRSLRQMAQIAGALGKTSDMINYNLKAANAARNFHLLFYNPTRGCYVDGAESTHASLYANMLPLAFGVVPPSEIQKVGKFVTKRGMASSVYGAQHLLEALFAADLESEAVKLMTRQEHRSWLNMLRSGSTITTEAWDLQYKSDMDWSCGGATAPANIIHRYLLGVRPLKPGFAEILIRPQIDTLEAAEGYTPTIRGKIHVSVRQVYKESYNLEIDIPANTTARVELPSFMADNGKMRLNGSKAQYIIDGYGRVVIADLPSGKHTLQWKTAGILCGSSSGNEKKATLKHGWRAWVPFF